MHSRPYILHGISPTDFSVRKAEIAELVREFGLVVLPSFLSENIFFRNFEDDLKVILLETCDRYSVEITSNELGEILSEISNQKPEIARIIADLGTQPNKFFSFNALKFSDSFGEFLSAYYGSNSLVLTPPSGDTLHFFPPGGNFHRYNLPVHQDYPYLMQSPDQLTFYLGISKFHPEVGGLRVWERSHTEGLLPTYKNSKGNFEISVDNFDMSKYAQVDIQWNPGDLGIFDSLLCHASIPNMSVNHSRIVQIFRFSNIDNDLSRSYDYYSSSYSRRSISFEDIHSDLFLKD
jgi:ectoine hydroxylase-related dioxygenase (phytanoyl-CoA dioxygenase family)